MSTISSTLPEAVSQVELDWYADGDVVRVVPRHQKRFKIQRDRALEILHRVKDADQFNQQFAMLLNKLAQWISARSDIISHAIVTLQDGMLAFVVIRKDAKYDERFQDDLADLDFDLANDADLDLIKLQTLALPNVTGDALLSFVDERLVLTYHGDRARPYPAS